MLGKLQVRIDHFLEFLSNPANFTVVELFCNVTLALSNLRNGIFQLLQGMADGSGNDSCHEKTHYKNTASYQKRSQTDIFALFTDLIFFHYIYNMPACSRIGDRRKQIQMVLSRIRIGLHNCILLFLISRKINQLIILIYDHKVTGIKAFIAHDKGFSQQLLAQSDHHIAHSLSIRGIDHIFRIRKPYLCSCF